MKGSPKPYDLPGEKVFKNPCKLEVNEGFTNQQKKGSTLKGEKVFTHFYNLPGEKVFTNFYNLPGEKVFTNFYNPPGEIVFMHQPP
jgi:hypothetical protein